MSQSPGVYVTKAGYDANTTNDATKFYFRSDQGTFKFIGLYQPTVTVNNYNNGSGGGWVTTTVTQNFNLPTDVNGFAPYYFVQFPSPGTGGTTYDFYDNRAISGSGSSAWVQGNPSGGNLTLYLKYPGGGTSPTNLTVQYNIYVFGNSL